MYQQRRTRRTPFIFAVYAKSQREQRVSHAPTEAEPNARVTKWPLSGHKNTMLGSIVEISKEF